MNRMKPVLFSAALVAASWVSIAGAQPVVTPPAPQAGGAAAAAAGGPVRGGRGPGVPVQIGPPAPVPPEVAQPSAAEITQINGAIKKLVDTDTSSAAPLLKKFESMLMLPVPRLNTAATYTQTAQRQGRRHEDFVEIAKKGDIDLLLHGDSITDWWVRGDANTEMFNKYFGGIKTANFAIAGDTTQGVLWGLKNGEGQGFSPKAVMLMIGTNNMGSNTPTEIAEGIGAVVLELRKDFPSAKILLLAIFPRGTPTDPVRDRIAITNKIIARLDDQKNVFFMDIGSKFLDEKGVFLPDAFQTDNLHPAARGYDIWGAAVKDKLAELMK